MDIMESMTYLFLTSLNVETCQNLQKTFSASIAHGLVDSRKIRAIKCMKKVLPPSRAHIANPVYCISARSKATKRVVFLLHPSSQEHKRVCRWNRNMIVV